MYFDGPAARWLQSIEHRAKYFTWDQFCKFVHDRFGRDQHEILIRQLFHIHQTGPIAAYIDQFAQLVDQLAAYTTTTDPMYYTLRFIDGLRDDIKSIVLVQHPKDLDTAFVLAALQEEVGDTHRRREFKRLESGFHSKPPSKNPLPLPAPPRDKLALQYNTANTRSVDTSRVTSPTDSKAAALRAYRRALGLCYKCSEKWRKEHKCSPIVQLHAVQELWDLFQIEDDVVSPNGSSDGSEQLFLAISEAATTGAKAPRTVKFHGSIQHKPVIILVDSGSRSSFINTVLAAQLTGTVPLKQDLKVQVAGGGILCCSQMIPQALWFIGDTAFQSDSRVLPISAYDVIIGMDWLEKYSPMRVHWKNKWMEIPYEKQTVFLQGITPHMPDEVVVQLCALSSQGATTTDLNLFPADIQALLDQFPTLFEDPTDLPPPRACDHAIPLIPGARPVNV
jgi:hypothetical protein